eukprot:6197226-Pleurochrysis_carterae.AAC.1
MNTARCGGADDTRRAVSIAAFARCAERQAKTTVAPIVSNWVAASSPMPALLPVMTTTRPAIAAGKLLDRRSTAGGGIATRRA